MPQYFCGVDCQVYMSFLTGSNRGSILINNAHTIMYRQESNKHPLYGFRDTRFSRIAKGRTIVRGMLVLNREFKNELSYAMLEHEVKEKPPIGRRPKPSGRYFPETSISAVVDEGLAAATSASSTLEQLKAIAERVRTAAVVGQISGIEKVPQTPTISNLKAWITETCISLTAHMGELNSQSPGKSQGASLLKEIMVSSPDPSSEDFVKNLKQMYWGATLDVPLSKAMASPDSDNIFDELEKGDPVTKVPRIVNLEIKFGNPDTNEASQYADHSETIEWVNFEGSYSQVSIDDRSINQIHYPFIARNLSGRLVTV